MLQLHNDNMDTLPDAAQGCTVVIGNFDGLHLGHRALIEAAEEIAAHAGTPLGVLTFEPHPREFFQPQGEPFRITLLPAKQRLLGAMNVQHLFVMAFDRKLAALSANEFIDSILVRGLGARHVVVGADFAFGSNRGGNADTLRKAAADGLFDLTVVEPVVCPDGDIYSSTRIRSLLRDGEFAAAAKLLGHPWEFEAEVVHGDKRGRDLGYPTANQRLARYLKPPYGVYAVRVQLEGEERWRDGAANFGIRPMFRIAEPIFETFIFDFSGDLYGKTMRVRPVAHLRPEMDFEGLEALKERIKQDCLAAQAVLKSSRL